MKILTDIPDGIYVFLMEHPDRQFPYATEWIRQGTPLPQCKDCKHFETDAFATIDGIQLIVGHEVCTKWGAGCKTKEDGYCFMFEPKE